MQKSGTPEDYHPKPEAPKARTSTGLQAPTRRRPTTVVVSKDHGFAAIPECRVSMASDSNEGGRLTLEIRRRAGLQDASSPYHELRHPPDVTTSSVGLHVAYAAVQKFHLGSAQVKLM